MFNSTVMWKTPTILKLDCILFAKPTRSSDVVVPENFSFCLQPKPVCPIYVQYMSWLNLPPSFLSSLSASPNKCKDCVLFISLFDISSLISYYKPQQVTIWQSVSCLIIEALCCVLFESPLRLFQPNINIWWELSAEMSATSAVYKKSPTAEQSFLLTPNPAFHCVSMCKIRTPLHLAGVWLPRLCVYCGGTSTVCRKPPLDSLERRCSYPHVKFCYITQSLCNFGFSQLGSVGAWNSLLLLA